MKLHINILGIIILVALLSAMTVSAQEQDQTIGGIVIDIENNFNSNVAYALVEIDREGHSDVSYAVQTVEVATNELLDEVVLQGEFNYPLIGLSMEPLPVVFSVADAFTFDMGTGEMLEHSDLALIGAGYQLLRDQNGLRILDQCTNELSPVELSDVTTPEMRVPSDQDICDGENGTFISTFTEHSVVLRYEAFPGERAEFQITSGGESDILRSNMQTVHDAFMSGDTVANSATCSADITFNVYASDSADGVEFTVHLQCEHTGWWAGLVQTDVWVSAGTVQIAVDWSSEWYLAQYFDRLYVGGNHNDNLLETPYPLTRRIDAIGGRNVTITSFGDQGARFYALLDYLPTSTELWYYNATEWVPVQEVNRQCPDVLITQILSQRAEYTVCQMNLENNPEISTWWFLSLAAE